MRAPHLLYGPVTGESGKHSYPTPVKHSLDLPRIASNVVFSEDIEYESILDLGVVRSHYLLEEFVVGNMMTS